MVKDADKIDPFFAENKFQYVSSQSLSFAHNMPFVETLGQYGEQTWPKSIQQVIIGEITADEMMDKLAETLNGE